METRAQTESPEFTDSKTRRLKSQELFRGQEEIIIEHGGCEYRLRKTRQDKLILTK